MPPPLLPEVEQAVQALPAWLRASSPAVRLIGSLMQTQPAPGVQGSLPHADVLLAAAIQAPLPALAASSAPNRLFFDCHPSLQSASALGDKPVHSRCALRCSAAE